MTEIGNYCRENRIFVRSGHAPGADQAFEQGAQEMCIAYIPWDGFERGFASRAKLRIPRNLNKLMEYTKPFHPAWDRLSQGAQKLMSRNVAQILGENMDKPSDIVFCWTPGGKMVGGTAQAIKIAEANKIKVVNLHNDRDWVSHLLF
jgi:hypothetical protein